MVKDFETPKSVNEPKQAAAPVAPAPEEQNPDHISRLEKTVAEKENQIEKLTTTAGSRKEDLGRLARNLEKVVSSYRAMVVKAHPDVPEELITGNSVDEIDSSLQQAVKIVERVKKALQQPPETQAVPAGAPARNHEPAAGLSAREKIQYAVGGNY